MVNNTTRIFLIVFSILLCDFFNPAFGKNVTESDLVKINHNLDVPGDKLCHDGIFIFYKDWEACSDYSNSSACNKSLRIAPLETVELISLEVGGQRLSRFYSINTIYEYKTFSVVDNEKTIVDQGQAAVNICHGKALRKEQAVGEHRYVKSLEERRIVEALLRSDITIVNSPIHGEITMDMLTTMKPNIEKELSAFQAASALKAPKAVCEQDTEKIGEILHLLSGEYSGNGVVRAVLREIQEDSIDLQLEMYPESSNNLDSHDQEMRFECTPQGWLI